MNTLTGALFVCLVVVASAKPGGIWGHGGGYGGYGGYGNGHGHGHLPVVGASGIVSSGGAIGPAGVVNGHGAVGPNGDHNAVDHGHAGILGLGFAGAGVGAWGHGDDGQWHGEGLLASQDLGGHHHGAIGLIGGHGLGLGLGGYGGIGLGHGGHW